MKKEIIFEFPTSKREKEAKKFIQEFIDNNSEINGTGGLDSAENYLDWVKKTRNIHKGVDIPKGKVSATTYFVIRKKDNKIIGMINIRHKLNTYLKESYGGHIGYCVRPKERKKGYGTKILEMGLAELKKRGTKTALLGCYQDNIASKKVILNCGGKQIGKSKEKGRISLGFKIKI